MGICGCAEGTDFLLATKGRVSAVSLIGPCKDCDETLILAIDVLDKEELRIERDGEALEVKETSRMTILDFSSAKEKFLKEWEPWFETEKGGPLDKYLMDVIFDDFIADIFKRSIQETWQKALKETADQ